MVNPLKFGGDNDDDKTRNKIVSVGMLVGSIVLLVVIFSAERVVTGNLPKLKRD